MGHENHELSVYCQFLTEYVAVTNPLQIGISVTNVLIATPSFECDHVESIKYITTYAENIELELDVLDQLVTMQRIDEDKK